MAGAGEDEGFGGSDGGAPSLFCGVADVAGVHAIEGGVPHESGVGEYVRGSGFGGGHGFSFRGIVARNSGRCKGEWGWFGVAVMLEGVG